MTVNKASSRVLQISCRTQTASVFSVLIKSQPESFRVTAWFSISIIIWFFQRNRVLRIISLHKLLTTQAFTTLDVQFWFSDCIHNFTHSVICFPDSFADLIASVIMMCLFSRNYFRLIWDTSVLSIRTVEQLELIGTVLGKCWTLLWTSSVFAKAHKSTDRTKVSLLCQE